MSFYGSVFYEFERLFFKFKFKNAADTADSVTDLEAIDSLDGITATERWDTFHIDSGNRWIKLATMPEGGERKGVTLFHAAPGPNTKQTLPIEPIELEENETADIVLSSTQAFKVPTIKYDNAGHISDVTTEVYQLPEPAQIIIDGMENHFEEPIAPQAISHETEDVEEDAEITQLSSGQVIAATKLLVSEKGVITGVEDVYYKMPQSETESNIEDLQLRMAQAEQDILARTLIAETGEAEDFYAPDSTIELTDRLATITDHIGVIEEGSRTIFKDYKQIHPLVDQILKVYELAQSVNVATSDNVEQLRSKVTALEARVEALEKA